MEGRRQLLEEIFHRLYRAFGPQHWWPAETPFEVIVGAILTQNTAWKNVQRSIEELRERRLLSLEALNAASQEELAQAVRSSGYYNQKAKKLKAFCRHIEGNWQNDLGGFLAQPLQNLRSELLSLYGIGPETADSIVLYAANQPSFVVDAYTQRIFYRHGWVPAKIRYPELRDFFMNALNGDVEFYKEYHALIVRTGHLYCRRKPSCKGCPLEEQPGNPRED